MNYCNCPNCRTDNCPAGVDYDTLKQENLRLKANHILANNALEDPKDLFVVLRKEDHQALKDKVLELETRLKVWEKPWENC